MGNGTTHPARREQSSLLVIDVQEKLLPAIDGGDEALKHTLRLVQAARLLGVPIEVTEQYPKGLGPTVAPLAAVLGGATPREKLSFSCCGDASLVEDLRSGGRSQVVVAGIEAHVCVQQTVLDLLAAGLAVYVAADATGSRRASDRQVALDRMRQAGAVVTTSEAVMFEWLRVAGTGEFKQVVQLVKEL